MSDTVQFVMPGCIMAIPKGRRVTVYEVVNSGFISDSRYTVVLDHCAQIYYGISPEIFNWLAQGMPGHPTFKLSKQTKGVVMWSHVIRNIGAPDISEVRVALNTAMAGLVPSITEGASPRIKLKTAHPEIFLSEAGIEQQWPSGALHSIIFEHPFQMVFHRAPSPGYERPSIDLHLRLQQRRAGELHTIALTLSVPPSPGLERVQVLVEHLPRIGAHDAQHLLTLLQRYADIHGRPWPL